MLTKTELRRNYINIREQLSDEYRNEANKNIIFQLENLKIFQDAEKVFIYIGFSSEIATMDIIKKYISKKRIFIPKIINGRMNLVEIFSVEELSIGYFGILESKSNNFYYGEIDLVVVPGLAFTRVGYRLGYGKGYYDSYLSNYKFKNSVGLCYEKLLIEFLPLELHDKAVKIVITENEILKIPQNDFIVTTNIRVTNALIVQAKQIANFFNVNYVNRNKLTLNHLRQRYKNIIIVYKNKISYVNEQAEELFFHLDTAMIRIKNKKEPLLDIIGEKNQKILDTTMGLCRDSIVLSYFGHNITALEENKIIHFIVSEGLKYFDSGDTNINNALRKITTYNINSMDFLKKCPDNSYDIVYVDPMFSNKIKDSNNIAIFNNLIYDSGLTKELLKEMKRVARKKVIVKAHNLDNVFKEFNFKKLERAGSKFTFAYIDMEKNNV